MTSKAIETVAVGEVLEIEIRMLERGETVVVAGAFAVLASEPAGPGAWLVTLATPRGPLHTAERRGHAVTVRA